MLSIRFTIKAISGRISKNIYRPLVAEQELINKTLEHIFLQPCNQLSDVIAWLDIFVFMKHYSFTNVKNEIFGYIYENYLKDLCEEEQKGQYFTDPAIVNFMLEEIGFTPQVLKQRYIDCRAKT